MGDFNYDFLNFEDCQVSEEFIDVIVSYQYLPHYLKCSMMIQLQFCNNDGSWHSCFWQIIQQTTLCLSVFNSEINFKLFSLCGLDVLCKGQDITDALLALSDVTIQDDSVTNKFTTSS